jgi:starvation-inducible DNA-binding protein
MTVQLAPTRSEAPSDKVAAALARLLADTYVLYLKTHAYHWNVTGPHFPALHVLFEAQYTELRDAVDEVAERIRALGPLAPGSYGQLARLTRLAEDEGAPDALEMVRRLGADHETLIATTRTVLQAAEAAGDAATIDLATRRLAVHEKTRWMLRATGEAGA